MYCTLILNPGPLSTKHCDYKHMDKKSAFKYVSSYEHATDGSLFTTICMWFFLIMS